MIYLGVDISVDRFNIVMLDHDFSFLDRRNFLFYYLKNIDPWIEQTKDIFDKNVKWFFDDRQFYRCNIAKKGAFTSYNQEFFLISHVKLQKLTKFTYDYMLQCDLFFPIDRPFLLASACRIIDNAFIKIYIPDDLPF